MEAGKSAAMSRQIIDRRLADCSEDEAHLIAKDHLYREMGNGTPVGWAIVDHPGGLQINLSWQQPINRGGRAGRKRWQSTGAKVVPHE